MKALSGKAIGTTILVILFHTGLCFISHRYWGITALALAFLLGREYERNTNSDSTESHIKRLPTRWPMYLLLWTGQLLMILFCLPLLYAYKYEIDLSSALFVAPGLRHWLLIDEMHHWLDFVFYGTAHALLYLRSIAYSADPIVEDRD